MVFRRSRGTSAWHWRRGCSAWPSQSETEERGELPLSGSLCPECEKLDLQSAFRRLSAEDERAAAAMTALRDGRLYA